MGERGLDDAPATDDDIAAMTDLVDEAMRRGALGFSTSRTLLHRVPDGRSGARHVGATRTSCSRSPTCSAGTARACTRSRRASSGRATNYEGTRAEIHWMAEINRRTGRPGDVRPRAEQRRTRAATRSSSTSSTRKPRRGGELRPQTTARGIGLLFGMQHRTFFDRAPSWQALAAARPRRAARRARRRRSGAPS